MNTVMEPNLRRWERKRGRKKKEKKNMQEDKRGNAAKTTGQMMLQGVVCHARRREKGDRWPTATFRTVLNKTRERSVLGGGG